MHSTYQNKKYIFGFGRGISPAVKYIIIFTSSFFIVQQILYIDWTGIFGVAPLMMVKGWVWQPLTYLFIHDSFLHIFFNMLFLWMFGTELERLWGTKNFLRYYFITGVGAGICIFLFKLGTNTVTLGASGAVLAVILAYGLQFPNRIVLLYFVIPIKVKYLVIIIIAFEFIATLSVAADTVSHIGHLSGMVIGFVYLKRGFMTRALARWLKRRLEQKMWEKQQKLKQEEEKIHIDVDELLDKINKIGLENLSREERKRLDEASRFLRDKSQQTHSD